MAEIEKGKEKRLKLIANTLRQDVIRMLLEACSGHTAGPLGMADVFAALYFDVMKHDPKNAKWDGRDRAILSNGHICPILYATLAESGYFPKEELMTLRKINSRLQGHPHNLEPPGTENSSGPLGQGISVACGRAIAAKMDRKGHRIFCLMSDGELNEGQPWEAFLFAAKYKLDNLVVIVDRNYIQIDGDTEEIMPLGSLAEKFSAFGWNAIDVDGHDINEILNACEKAKNTKGKPTAIIANTIPGKGVSFMEKKFEWHGKPPNAEEAKKALEELEAERKRIEAE